MKLLKSAWLPMLIVLSMLSGSAAWGKAGTQANPRTKMGSGEQDAAGSSGTEAQKKNLQAYIDLLRQNVRQQKAEIMGSIMALSASDAAKFWPIYDDYDVALAKLNNQRVENIEDYARSYDQMTDQKADELVQKALAYQRQRAELLANTYEKVKQVIGAVSAARFAQIESQLLLLLDLQIDSSLPIVNQGL